MKTEHFQDAESALRSFLTAWIERNQEEMFRYSQKTWKSLHNETWLKTLLSRHIDSFEIHSHEVAGEYAIDFMISINNNPPSNIRVIAEISPYHPGIGEWGVNPIAALRLIKKRN